MQHFIVYCGDLCCKYWRTSTIKGCVSSGNTSSTGWIPMTGFGPECVSRCTSIYTTWRLDTCRRQPVFVVTYARLVVVNWTFHVSIWLRTGDGRLPMLVPHLGTLYLTVSRTLILLCKPSNAILRVSFFLHTSTFSAFEVSYKNAQYKSTVIIIIIINRCTGFVLHSLRHVQPVQLIVQQMDRVQLH